MSISNIALLHIITLSMDGETAVNFSSCLSDIMAVKVYGEPEASSTSGTREHSSRYHRTTQKTLKRTSGRMPG